MDERFGDTLRGSGHGRAPPRQSHSCILEIGSRMTEPNRKISSDCLGLALVAMTVFLVISLLSYDPADPITGAGWPLSSLADWPPLVHPISPTVQNACGRLGAAVSAILFNALGMAALIVAVTPGFLAYRLMRFGRIESPAVRSLGWTLCLLGMSALLGISGWAPAGMPVVGGGGHLGAMAALFLQDNFASVGSWILALTVTTFGLLLCTEYALLKLLQKATRVVWQASQISLRTAGRAQALKNVVGRSGPRLDVPERIYLDGESQEEDPPIVVRRRRGKASAPQPSATAPAADEVIMEVPPAPALPEAAAVPPIEPEEEDEAPPASAAVAEREVEIGGEIATVRADSGHGASNIRVKSSQQRRDERQQIMDELTEDLPEGADDYVLPSVELLEASEDLCFEEQTKEVRRKAKILEKTFGDFGFNVRVVEIESGPVIAQYEVELEAGLRLSKITGLADDLAIALRVPSVRIVAPIPGKNTVGIEVPNENRQTVRLRDVIEESGSGGKKMNIPIFLGKDVSGAPLTVDLASMPHLLIAGRTGTGKSVCLNAIITSMLMTRRPDEVRMLMIDPKMVELSGYGRLPHLMHPVVTDMKKAEAILAWAVEKMEERYSLLAKVGVRHISSYNQLGREELLRRLEIDEADDADGVPDHLPFIVIVADEMADLMMTAGKDVEQHIIRLAQKSRAVGIHLILATQKPTVDVITGLIKSNLPARLSFQVASRTDSRVVLDENGADKLLGNGDMLFLWPGTSTLLRGQGTYLDDAEIERVVAHCSTGEQHFVGELMNLKVKDEDGEAEGAGPTLRKRDELYESAIEVVVREGRGSVSLLQRALGIGYGRGARLIDYMAEDGIVGEYNGSQARDVLITAAQWEAMQNGEAGDGAEANDSVEDAEIGETDEDYAWDDEEADSEVMR